MLTAWKVSKYEVISGPYFPVFGLNTGKYGPEITSYLDTFHAVVESQRGLSCVKCWNQIWTDFSQIKIA